LAPVAIGAPGDGLHFRPTIGDSRINYGQAANSITMGSSGLGEPMSTHISNAMTQDPKPSASMWASSPTPPIAAATANLKRQLQQQQSQ
jgi:hypothetical protein